MIVSSKEIMKRIAQKALVSGKVTAEEYAVITEDLGIPDLDVTIRAQRIDPKTGVILNGETINLTVVTDMAFLSINSGRVKKTWKMSLATWHHLNGKKVK